MIVSMAYTTEAFLDGSKTVTRRFWQPSHAVKFPPGKIFDVWNRSPRRGGIFIGKAVSLVLPYEQYLRDMPDDHFEREGGIRYWKNKRDFIKVMGGYGKKPFVLEFNKIPHRALFDSRDGSGMKCLCGEPAVGYVYGLKPVCMRGIADLFLAVHNEETKGTYAADVKIALEHFRSDN